MSEKKNLSFLVLNILRRYSSKETPMTKSKIEYLLKMEHERDCDPRTIGAALESLTALGYPIRYKTVFQKNKSRKTNWYIEPVLDEENNNKLYLSLLCSEYLSNCDIEQIKDSLSPTLPYPSFLDTVKVKKTENSSCTPIIKSLNVIYKAIKDKYMISFSVIEYIGKDKIHFTESSGHISIYLVKPIEIISAYGNLSLFCELGDTGIYRFFEIESLYDIRVTDIKNQEPHLYSAPLPKNRLECRAFSFANREKAVLRIDSEYISEIAEMLGNEWQVICRYSDKAEISVMAELRTLKRYILSLGSAAEVLSPTKLRRSIATELQKTASKYKEIRKLYGQL